MTAQDFSNMRNMCVFIGADQSSREDLCALARRWRILYNRKIIKNLRISEDRMRVIHIPENCDPAELRSLVLERYFRVYLALPTGYTAPDGQLTKSTLNDKDVLGHRVYVLPAYLNSRIPTYIDESESYRKNIVFAGIG